MEALFGYYLAHRLCPHSKGDHKTVDDSDTAAARNSATEYDCNVFLQSTTAPLLPGKRNEASTIVGVASDGAHRWGEKVLDVLFKIVGDDDDVGDASSCAADTVSAWSVLVGTTTTSRVGAGAAVESGRVGD